MQPAFECSISIENAIQNAIQILELSYNFFSDSEMLDFGKFGVSITQDAVGYFEIVWLLSLWLQVCLKCCLLFCVMECKLSK